MQDDHEKDTPLHIACKYRHSKIATLLVEAGATATKANRAGITPLHIAARFNDADMLEFMLLNGADANTTASLKG